MSNNKYLIYINPIGKDSNDLFEYEFFFSETPEIVWGEDWDVLNPGACENTLPDPTTYSVIKTIKTDIPLYCMQHNTCFPFYYVTHNIVCLAYEDISTYTEYPEPIRLVFKFSEEYNSVEEKLNMREIYF